MKRKSMFRKVVSLTCTFALVAGVLAGCGGGAKGNTVEGDTKQPVKEERPYEISLMVTTYATEPPKADNPILAEIQKYTNTKLDIIWVPNTTYTDKLNALIAANELPNVVLIGNHKSANILSGARSGAFWEIGSFFKDFKNLSKANPQILQNASIDGKAFGIYRSRILARDGFVYRKDWADKLGIKEPTTIDEFYNMAKAFTYDDPDQNGKNDTIGVPMHASMYGFNIIESWFGSPNSWGEQNGKLVPNFMTEEYMEAQKFLRKMYSEKIINQDFAVFKSLSEIMNKGKGGIALQTIDNAVSGYTDLFKLEPDAKLEIANPIKGPKGEKIPATSGYNGQFMIPKSSVKTETDLKKILEFFDKMNDDAMGQLLDRGIENRHYTIADGKVTRNEEQTKLVASEVNELRQLTTLGTYVSDTYTPMAKKVQEMQANNEKFVVHNPTLPLISQTDAEKSGEIGKLTSDARIKYIMGEIDEAGWQKAIEQWRKSGGDKIIEEYNAEYAKLKK